MSKKHSIPVSERFDFSSYRSFYDQCEAAMDKPGVSELSIDFRLTRYLDSAALGMLVQMHRKARERNVRLRICNAEGIVLETLKIANMATLYEFD